MRFTECIIALLKHFFIFYSVLQTPEDPLRRQNCLQVEHIETWLFSRQRSVIFAIVQCSALVQLHSLKSVTLRRYSHIYLHTQGPCLLQDDAPDRYICRETLKYRGNLLRLDICFCFLHKKQGLKRSCNRGRCHPTNKEND